MARQSLLTTATALANTGITNAATAPSTATRVNQVALGSASSTYTVAGIGSAASTSAQVGPTRYVTGDAGGNLGYSSFGPADITDLQSSVGTLGGQVNFLGNQVANLQGQSRQANGGIAAAMAMRGALLPPDTTVAVSFNLATYRGEQGFSGALVARVSDHVWVSGGFADSTVKGSTGGRAGVTA